MECSICNEDYDTKDHKPYTIFPCGHCFCLKCINLLTQQQCPNCRGILQSKIVNRGVLDIIEQSKQKSTNKPLSLVIETRSSAAFSNEYKLNASFQRLQSNSSLSNTSQAMRDYYERSLFNIFVTCKSNENETLFESIEVSLLIT